MSRRVIRKRKDRATADCPLDPSPLLLNAHGRVSEPLRRRLAARGKAAAPTPTASTAEELYVRDAPEMLFKQGGGAG
jgi:hypothetical protein